eukprot:318854-Chlamydomonas_euryale.AAC.3
MLRHARSVPMPHNGQATQVRAGIHTGSVVRCALSWPCAYTHMQASRQAGRQPCRRADSHAGRQAGRQPCRQAGKQLCRQAGCQSAVHAGGHAAMQADRHEAMQAGTHTNTKTGFCHGRPASQPFSRPAFLATPHAAPEHLFSLHFLASCQ